MSIQLAKPLELATPLQTLVRVHLQQPSGGSSNRRQAHQQGAVHLEVIRPEVAARMKQADDLVGVRVGAREVCALVQIALVACQGEVVVLIAAAVLAGNYVLDMERMEAVVLLPQMAILATIAGAL